MHIILCNMISSIWVGENEVRVTDQQDKNKLYAHLYFVSPHPVVSFSHFFCCSGVSSLARTNQLYDLATEMLIFGLVEIKVC